MLHSNYELVLVEYLCLCAAICHQCRVMRLHPKSLSDLAGCEVVIGSASELSALGAAYMAGIRTGLYASFADIPAAQSAIYSPEINEEERCRAMNAWASAVQRAR